MDNVLNRPLFRRRDARDHLNDMAGVKKFQDGGPVPRAPQVSGQASGLAAIPTVIGAASPGYLDLVRKAQRGGKVTWEDYTALLENEDVTAQQAQDILTLVENPGLVIGEEEARLSMRPELQRMPQVPSDPRQSSTLKGAVNYLGDVFGGTTAGEVAAREAGVAADQAAFDQYTAKGGFEGALRELREGDADIFGRLERASGPSFERKGREGLTLPPGPSGMEAEARGSRPPVATETMPEPVVPEGPAFEQKGRGPGPLVTSPAEVAAGLNDPSPEVREKTVADFMKEFTDAAPEYKGGDKRLMHAMIGFAIAAGDSPNAMTNIARGLQSGAEMFLKDKASKDEFDRQIQLSAMQYGLGEVGKERALERQFSNYVASKEVTYRGRKYGANETVPVLHSDLLNGKLPEGVVSESLADAMLTTDAALRKAAAEALKERTLSPEQYRASITSLDEAASSFSAARNLIPLIESSLIRNAEGQVTGLVSGFTSAANKAANAVGVDLGARYESPEAFQSAMKNVSVQMVQDLLGESGKTISDADRKLIDDLLGVQADMLSNVTKDPDVLNRKLQEILKSAESKQQSALDSYNTLMEGLGGTLTPSGTAFGSYKAERVFNPPAQERIFRYDVTEDGKYVKVYEGQ
jgi:hypothetical protein